MTKIDVISGFLGAGKTTLVKKLLKESLNNTKVVLIENEFGEIGIDGGFLKEAGIEIKEMNSGCICCSLVGDFGTSLEEVISVYAPERILIEPSGVGKLSDVIKAVKDVGAKLDVEINSAVTVVDATKCKMYMKNLGEFFLNQIENAGTVILSRTNNISQEKLGDVIKMIQEHNETATIITTPWEQLEGNTILQTIEGAGKIENMMKTMLEAEHKHHHHDHDEECSCHDHDHHHHDHDEKCGCHDHGHHHHEHDAECSCGCHDHEHTHGHHHADEVFASWGKETINLYSEDEIKTILEALDSGEYGMILRAKGMVKSSENKEEQLNWIYFDFVPTEHNIREGNPDVTGKICVIGADLKEDKLAKLFRVEE